MPIFFEKKLWIYDNRPFSMTKTIKLMKVGRIDLKQYMCVNGYDLGSSTALLGNSQFRMLSKLAVFSILYFTLDKFSMCSQAFIWFWLLLQAMPFPRICITLLRKLMLKKSKIANLLKLARTFRTWVNTNHNL